ncbi:MAG: SIS domain-containing protein [Gemmatimonadota bacterium]|nr:MAG: SIS domain-containing protein [Gemmatimonadota bacterium]
MSKEFQTTDLIKTQLEESGALKKAIAETMLEKIAGIAEVLVQCLKDGHTIFLCGNGGSAADAQHIAGELSCRLRIERDGLSAFALTTNPSVLTALANDYSYNEVFSRQVKALAHSGDCLIGISTSGTSESINLAVKQARNIGVTTIGLTGRGGGTLAGLVDYALVIPSHDTQRIQEAHITIGHIFCDVIERELFPQEGIA